MPTAKVPTTSSVIRTGPRWPSASPPVRRATHAWIFGWNTTSVSARRSRIGTTVSKTVSGRWSRSHAPTSAPQNDAGICHRNRSHCPRSSRRYPQVPETPPATRPIALDIVAVTGGTPNATSVGKVMRVPDPTRELIAPAPSPANATRKSSSGVTEASLRRAVRTPDRPCSGSLCVFFSRKTHTTSPNFRLGRRHTRGHRNANGRRNLWLGV